MNSFESRIQSHRLIPVVSLPDVESGIKLGKILVNCDMEVAEITFRTAHAAQGIAAMKKHLPQLLLLAGTVLTVDQVDSAVSAGAEAIVSPGTDPEIITHCRNLNIPIFPGVCTPSEVQLAMSLGVTSLKFFPAELSGGIKMVKTLLSVYRNISLMPTGGITPANVKEYLDIDRVICCGGTWLAPESMLAAGDWQGIEKRIKAAVIDLQSRYF
jgi:2-dehydro-3-deoxyphosphogluconate aldolase/(4S)-4-hydroxy-2-oxoglutarate aldolase